MELYFSIFFNGKNLTIAFKLTRVQVYNNLIIGHKPALPRSIQWMSNSERGDKDKVDEYYKNMKNRLGYIISS